MKFEENLHHSNNANLAALCFEFSSGSCAAARRAAKVHRQSRRHKHSRSRHAVPARVRRCTRNFTDLERDAMRDDGPGEELDFSGSASLAPSRALVKRHKLWNWCKRARPLANGQARGPASDSLRASSRECKRCKQAPGLICSKGP